MADQELSGSISVRSIRVVCRDSGFTVGQLASVWLLMVKNIENGKYYFTNVFCSFDSMVVGFNGSF